jgi:hypothetical protein
MDDRSWLGSIKEFQGEVTSAYGASWRQPDVYENVGCVIISAVGEGWYECGMYAQAACEDDHGRGESSVQFHTQLCEKARSPFGPRGIASTGKVYPIGLVRRSKSASLRWATLSRLFAKRNSRMAILEHNKGFCMNCISKSELSSSFFTARRQNCDVFWTKWVVDLHVLCTTGDVTAPHILQDDE